MCIYQKVATRKISVELDVTLSILCNFKESSKSYVKAYKKLKNNLINERVELFGESIEEIDELDIRIDMHNILEMYDKNSF